MPLSYLDCTYMKMPILDFSWGCGDNWLGAFCTFFVPHKPVSFKTI